jgi:hypothetical protein
MPSHMLKGPSIVLEAVALQDERFCKPAADALASGVI